MTTLPVGSAPRVLVLIERPAIVELVRLTLNHGVCTTRVANGVAEALAVLDEWQPHLAVIEVESAADQLLRRIVQARVSNRTQLPVLALTQRGDLQTRLTAFEHGVDDIMSIPFSPEELLARVLALTRRAYGQALSLAPLLKLGELEIDIVSRQVRIGEETFRLTGVELSLLYLLAAHAGQVLTRDAILDAIWGVDFAADSNVVDRHIRNLRTKLQNGYRQPRYIATVPGRGYRFILTSSNPGHFSSSDLREDGSMRQ